MPIIGLILCILSFFVLRGINDTYCTYMEEVNASTTKKESSDNSNIWDEVSQELKESLTPSLELISADMVCTKSFGSIYDTYITGEIKNNTNKKYSYVGVSFILYDGDGAQIGTAVDNIFDLEPNGTWKFKATTLEYDKVSNFKLYDITSW